MATSNPENLEKVAKKTASNVTHIADAIPDSVKNIARETAAQLAQQAGTTLEKVQDTAGETFDEVKKFAKKNPLATVAIGFAAGILLGAIMRRD